MRLRNYARDLIETRNPVLVNKLPWLEATFILGRSIFPEYSCERSKAILREHLIHGAHIGKLQNISSGGRCRQVWGIDRQRYIGYLVVES